MKMISESIEHLNKHLSYPGGAESTHFRNFRNLREAFRQHLQSTLAGVIGV